MSHLEINNVISVHCNNAKNVYQHDLIVFSFVSNKSTGQLLDISSKKLYCQRALT